MFLFKQVRQIFTSVRDFRRLCSLLKKVQMTGKVFLISILTLITFVSAQDIRQDRFKENPCTGERFARNSRGCSWYFICNLETNEVDKEDRCPDNLYFDETQQMCDYPDYVTCDIPAPPTHCLDFPDVHMISHPNSCSMYTGLCYLNPLKCLSD